MPDLRSLEPLGRELPKVDLRRLALLSPFVVLDGGQLVQPKVVVEQRAPKGVAEPPPLRVVHIARVVLVLLPDVVLALLLTSLPLTFRRHSATLATGQRRRRSRLIRLALARGQDDAIRGIVGRTARLLSRVVAGRVGRSGKAAHRLDLIFEGLEREVVEDTSGRLPNRLGARATLVLHEVHLLRDGATLQVDGRAGLAKDAVDDGRVGVEHLAQARVLAPAYAQVVARTPKRVDVGTLRLTVLAPVALGHGSGHELKRGLDGSAASSGRDRLRRLRGRRRRSGSYRSGELGLCSLRLFPCPLATHRQHLVKAGDEAGELDYAAQARVALGARAARVLEARRGDHAFALMLERPPAFRLLLALLRRLAQAWVVDPARTVRCLLARARTTLVEARP